MPLLVYYYAFFFVMFLIIIDQLVKCKYIDFKDESVSTSKNGQLHYKGQNARSQIVCYREVPLLVLNYTKSDHFTHCYTCMVHVQGHSHEDLLPKKNSRT